LGVEYCLTLALLSFGLYLGIETYNVSAEVPHNSFDEQVAGLHDLHFAYDTASLSPDAPTLLEQDAKALAEIFKKYPKSTVLLQGSCDEKGSDAYNFQLGYKRAETVQQALVAAGLEVSRFNVTTNGKHGSLCPSNEEACRQNSRRVHLVVHQY
jgi:peptidoglycan-associated lipoprotein